MERKPTREQSQALPSPQDLRHCDHAARPIAAVLRAMNTEQPDITRLEIEITTFCNLGCYSCDRSCRQAPSDEQMTLEQIRRFLDDSLRTGKRWNRIRILGGEPTLHPDIIEICDMLFDYKRRHSPHTGVQIVTNDYGDRVRKMLRTITERYDEVVDYDRAISPVRQDVSCIDDSQPKTSPVNSWFNTYNIAPIDDPACQALEMSGDLDYSAGCGIPRVCGIGLTRYGYYGCGAGASVDRVLGWDIGIKDIAMLNVDSVRQQFSILCRYCGHFKPPSCARGTVRDMSESWVAAYKKYKKKRPPLSLY